MEPNKPHRGSAIRFALKNLLIQVVMLAHKYPQFLAKPGDAQGLKETITCYLNSSDSEKIEYSKCLIEKSKNYSIEESVRRHLDAFESC